MKQRHYRRLTLEDRCQIFVALKNKLSMSQIAKDMGVHKSTISRELKRNADWRYKYYPRRAHIDALKRRRHCHRPPVITDWIEGVVIHGLFLGWSPEQIAGRLKRECHLNLCAQTIYNFVHTKEPNLRCRLSRWGKRGVGRFYQQQKLKNDGRIFIQERSEAVNRRNRYGHWERDSAVCKNSQKVLVCVERKSRFTKIIKLSDQKSITVSKLTMNLVQNSPLPCLSLTNDNGTEFSDGKNMSIPVFYCQPHSPHQRGTSENTIGILRRHLKTTTDLETLKANDIQDIEDHLNLTPRKCLNFKTPFEAAYRKTVALVI
jgi:transposase, IS30 family